MSEPKHTPEPWHRTNAYVYRTGPSRDTHRNRICSCSSEDVALRIVNDHNACASINPAAVTAMRALVERVAYYHTEDCEEENKKWDKDRCTCFCRDARAALALAKPEPKGETDGVHD